MLLSLMGKKDCYELENQITLTIALSLMVLEVEKT